MTDVGAPWTHRAVIAVGGLTELGFVPDTALLLVASHQGRGLIDCEAGERIARDPDEDARRWFDPSRPAVLGIGRAAGVWVEVSGLAGGRPTETTADGWRAIPGGSGVLLDGPGAEQQITTGGEDLRALSFSPDGQFFVVATPGDVTVYARYPHRP